MRDSKRLSDNIADAILAMITIEKKFGPGEKLPNENELSELLEVSRTTLREAIRSLVAQGYLEIRRGLGTFVQNPLPQTELDGMDLLRNSRADVRDLYEMRLIMEPEAAYYAALRGTDMELGRIAEIAVQVEGKIVKGQDRTELEHQFHQSIARATHNEFMNQIIPVLQEAIRKGVALAEENKPLLSDTIQDHKMIIEFLLDRNAEGARQAMKIHMLHAMQKLELDK